MSPFRLKDLKAVGSPAVLWGQELGSCVAEAGDHRLT